MTIHDEVAIYGSGLEALRQTYEVRVGPLGAHTLSWSDTQITFAMPAVDPGFREVVLSPREAHLSSNEMGSGTATDSEATATILPEITVGSVSVAKFVLPPSGVEFVEGMIKVRLSPQALPDDVAIEGDSFTREFPELEPSNLLSRWYLVDVLPGSELERIRSYAMLDAVEVAQYEGTGLAARAPNDPYYSSLQYNVQRSRLTALWEVKTGGVGVAILDTGVRTDHEELSGLVTVSRDFTGTGLAPCDGHGTGVASIAGAKTNNALGIAGGAWAPVLGSYKVLGILPGCRGQVAWLEQAITQAVADGFRVINMSIQGYPQQVSTQNVITNAWNAGTFLVASAGNSNTNALEFPAAYNQVFAVANTTSNDTRYADPTFGSNFGNWVDLAAPGTDIVMANIMSMNSYALGTGTSMSSPLVAGAAAVLMGAGYPNASIADRLLAYADPVDWDPTRTGEGRMNAYRALLPSQACLRDIPQGSWIRFDDGRILQVTGASKARHVPSPTVLSSWLASSESIWLCPERRNEFVVETSKWGFRPGSLVRHPGGRIFLITTDGADRGLPQKRWITSPSVFDCFGWSSGNVIDGSDADLGYHPDGPQIDTCISGARLFPNGSIVRSPDGAIYVIDIGTKRHIPTPDVLTTWFAPAEVTVNASDLELASIPLGTKWGVRQGKLIQESGLAPLYFVTDDGVTRASGSRRWFVTPNSLVERGYAGRPVIAVSNDTLGLHPPGAALLDADKMP